MTLIHIKKQNLATIISIYRFSGLAYIHLRNEKERHHTQNKDQRKQSKGKIKLSAKKT